MTGRFNSIICFSSVFLPFNSFHYHEIGISFEVLNSTHSHKILDGSVWRLRIAAIFWTILILSDQLGECMLSSHRSFHRASRLNGAHQTGQVWPKHDFKSKLNIIIPITLAPPILYSWYTFQYLFQHFLDLIWIVEAEIPRAERIHESSSVR